MKIEKRKNVVNGSAWGCINRCVQTILTFFARALIVKRLGTEYVGLHSLFISILTVLNLSDLGLSSAIAYNMYRPIAEDDRNSICAWLKLYRNVYKVIAIVVFVSGIIVMPFLSKLSNNEGIDENIYMLYLIYLLNTVQGYLLFAYKNSLFEAHQRTDIIYKIQTFVQLGQNGLQILILLLYPNYYIYSVIILLFTIIQNVSIEIASKKMYKDYECKGAITKDDKHNLIKQVVGIFIGRINTLSRNQLDPIFVSGYLGLMVNGMLSNYLYLISGISSFVLIPGNVMVAGIGNSLILDDVDKNIHTLDRWTFAIQFFIGIIGCVIAGTIQPLICIWVGKENSFNDMMGVICAIYFYFLNIYMCYGVYTNALGMWWEMKFVAIIEIFINITLNYIFINIWGVYGVLIATIFVIVMYETPIYIRSLFKKYFGIYRTGLYVKNMVKYIISFIVISVVCYKVSAYVFMDNMYFMLIFRGIMCTVMSTLYYTFLYRNNNFYIEVKKMLIDRVVNLLKS